MSLSQPFLEPGYTIRPAQADELPRLAEIEQSAASLFLNTPYAFLMHGEPLSLDFVQQQCQAGQVWIVADAQNVVVGFAITQELDGTLYLHEIDVDPNHGQKGLGSALVRHICDWAKGQGYRVVTLSTFRDIPWNAPFYAKLGFRPLDDSELTPGFHQIRVKELAAGLPIAERLMMQREL